MRIAGRVALALVVVMAVGMLAPGPWSRAISGRALAQIPFPTPTLPDPEPTPEPTPTATETPTPEPTEPGEDDDPKDDPGKPGDSGSDENEGADEGAGNDGKDDASDDAATPTDEYLRVPGSYSTDRLLFVAARLRSLGWSRHDVTAKVFPPFIIGGPANWIDSWGAPRFGPGTLIRTHEGQDVFCRYGDPVLAVENGTVEYGEGGLGGTVARIHRDDGSYWYYAHLSEVNDKDFPSGSEVHSGDVIGYCGNTGNAITTPPHVHFGWYRADGSARNPMRRLVRWLREAEEHALVVAARAQGKRVAAIDSLVSARRFGDAFAPDLSELSVSGESLLSSGSSPAAGTFGLAEAALEAALSGEGFADVGGDTQASSYGADPSRLVGDNRMSSLLQSESLSSRDVAGE